jgi:hypothetical protein
LKDDGMQESQSLNAAIEVIASNPKVATSVAIANTAIGGASSLAILQGWGAFLSLCIGILTGIVVLAYQTIKLVRFWRAKEQ